MGKMDEEKSKIDEDILRCRANILRARDIIPPFGPKKQKEAIGGIEQPITPVNEEVKPDKSPKKAPIEIRSIPEFEDILFNSAERSLNGHRYLCAGPFVRFLAATKKM